MPVSLAKAFREGAVFMLTACRDGASAVCSRLARFSTHLMIIAALIFIVILVAIARVFALPYVDSLNVHPGVMLDVPVWNQYDLTAGRPNPYGAATCVAMICRYYDSVKGLQKSFNLLVAGGNVNAKTGHTRRGDLTDAVGGTATTDHVGRAPDAAAIRAQLDAGHLVEAWSNSPRHHYVIVGYRGSKFWINDPAGGKREPNHWALNGYFQYAGRHTPPPPYRIGILTSDHDLCVKAGGLSAKWVGEAGEISTFQMAGDRIAALRGKTLFVKEGLNGTWASEHNDTPAFALSNVVGEPASAPPPSATDNSGSGSAQTTSMKAIAN